MLRLFPVIVEDTLSDQQYGNKASSKKTACNLIFLTASPSSSRAGLELA
jgi:hypothetical protein